MFFLRLGVENDDSFCQDGAPDTGGTLKIYGEALRKEVYFRSATTLLHHRCKTLYMPISFCVMQVPYKTLLLSVQDTAGGVVREMVEKYGLPKSEAPHFCLVQVIMMTMVMTANSLMTLIMMKILMMMNKHSVFLSPQSNLSMPEDGAPGVVVGGGTTRFVLYTSINSILQMLCCLLHIVGDGITILLF